MPPDARPSPRAAGDDCSRCMLRTRSLEHRRLEFPGSLKMPPTLDRAGLENSASSNGGWPGFADREMKRCRHLVADRTVRSDRVVVSTPSLAF
jgi:hypothetical protein